jgi:hypothetical protein
MLLLNIDKDIEFAVTNLYSHCNVCNVGTLLHIIVEVVDQASIDSTRYYVYACVCRSKSILDCMRCWFKLSSLLTQIVFVVDSNCLLYSFYPSIFCSKVGGAFSFNFLRFIRRAIYVLFYYP